MTINPKQLILETVHKSLIVFLENVNLDQKIKLASDLLKKFQENCQMEKINKLKSLIILKNFKTEILFKNKFFRILNIPNSNNQKQKDIQFSSYELNCQKNSESNRGQKERNISGEDKKEVFPESSSRSSDKKVNERNFICNSQIKNGFLDEKLVENKLEKEKEKESEKNELQESSVYNETNNSLRRSKRLQIG